MRKRPKPPRKRRHAARPERRQSPAANTVVLDVQIHFSTHITQHVAVRSPNDGPLSDWTMADLDVAVRAVESLLPRKDALDARLVSWWDKGRRLRISISGVSDGPFLVLTIRDFPLDTFIRCFGEHVTTIMANCKGWTVRDALSQTPSGSPIHPGTLRDEYARRLDDGNIHDELDRRDAEEVAAIQAARRAAGLPQLPRKARAR